MPQRPKHPLPSVNVIEKRQAKNSDAVSFSAPQVIHETSNLRVEFVAYYSVRDGEKSLVRCRLDTRRKKGHIIVPDRSLDLSESAARRLFELLRNVLMITDEDSGNYVFIKLTNGSASFERERDKAKAAQALNDIVSNPEFVSHLKNQELSSFLREAIQGAVRISEVRSALAQLRRYLDDGEKREHKYQKWCEEHSWAFGNAYIVRDSVRNISRSDSVDLLMPNALTSYRDIVELKRPDMEVLRHDKSHESYYFSEDASIAIGQCHRYLDVFHRAAEKGLDDAEDIISYHPRAIIVMGRSVTWDEKKRKALHGLNQRLHGVSIMTYDCLMTQGERMLQILSERQTHTEEHESAESIIEHDPPDVSFG